MFKKKHLEAYHILWKLFNYMICTARYVNKHCMGQWRHCQKYIPIFILCFWTCTKPLVLSVLKTFRTKVCNNLNSISPDLWQRSHPRARTRFWHCWWLFFSWSKIFSFPFIKHAFSYNTVFNGFFEDKSNVVKLGSRSAEILSLEALWRFTCGKT